MTDYSAIDHKDQHVPVTPHTIVYGLSNCGADDNYESGPDFAKNIIADLAERDDDNGRIHYFLVPASEIVAYTEAHSCRGFDFAYKTNDEEE